MKPFTFYLYDGVHPSPGFDFVNCKDETEAVVHAEMLLQRFPEYRMIEIYDGRSVRRRISRGDTAPRRTGEATFGAPAL